MAEVLFINEEYFKRNISHLQLIDSAKIVSSIRLVQKTNLTDIITLPVYNHYQELLSSSTAFSDAEKLLFDNMQLYLVVKTAEEMLYASPDAAKDGAHLAYKQKANLMEARVVRNINADPALLALAQSGSEEFNDAEMDTAGGFYFV